MKKSVNEMLNAMKVNPIEAEKVYYQKCKRWMNTPPENRRSDRRSPTARPQKSYTPAVGQTPCV